MMVENEHEEIMFSSMAVFDQHFWAEQTIDQRNFGDRDVGDVVILVTFWRWLIWDVEGRIIMLATFFIMLVIFARY